jgi:deoxycytidylate deaminase
MRLAKQVGEDGNPCYSRHIGVVIVNPHHHRLVGTGYNGPPRDTPHCDDPEYLREVVFPQLTPAEISYFYEKNDTKIAENGRKLSEEGRGILPETLEEKQCRNFVETAANCKTCPRKLIGAPSGKRLELCSCAHAETNAIVNAGQDLHGCVMFCWCGVPCYECTKLIINSGIMEIWVINWGADYSDGSRYLFKKKGVTIHEHVPSYYEEA